MLGRFLEISVPTPDVLTSLQFYLSLGLQQVPVGDIWSHPYAVVTDGRLFLGLHEEPVNKLETPAIQAQDWPALIESGRFNQHCHVRHFTELTLTFVQADVGAQAEKLRAAGVKLLHEVLGHTAFNEVRFNDPVGRQIRLIEARTFSPPHIAANFMSQCGYFEELGLPVKETAPVAAFWEQLGLVAMAEALQPFPRCALTYDHLNVGLYRSRALRHPVLTFTDAAMQERLQRLQTMGFAVSDEMPDALDSACNGVLIAPEGTRLLLLQSEELYG